MSHRLYDYAKELIGKKMGWINISLIGMTATIYLFTQAARSYWFVYAMFIFLVMGLLEGTAIYFVKKYHLKRFRDKLLQKKHSFEVFFNTVLFDVILLFIAYIFIALGLLSLL